MFKVICREFITKREKAGCALCDSMWSPRGSISLENEFHENYRRLSYAAACREIVQAACSILRHAGYP